MLLDGILEPGFQLSSQSFAKNYQRWFESIQEALQVTLVIGYQLAKLQKIVLPVKVEAKFIEIVLCGAFHGGGFRLSRSVSRLFDMLLIVNRTTQYALQVHSRGKMCLKNGGQTSNEGDWTTNFNSLLKCQGDTHNNR